MKIEEFYKDIKNIFFPKRAKDKSSYPGFYRRAFSALIDLFLILLTTSVVNYLIQNILYENGEREEMVNILINFLSNKELYLEDMHHINSIFWHFFVEQVVDFIILSLFFITFWYKKGSTPGKSLLRLQIVNAENLSAITLKQSCIRFFSYIISFLPFCLGFFWVLIDDKKQAWHDKLSKCIVIYKDKQK